MALLPVAANACILSLTATGDGTPIGNAIFSVTTSTCMWPPIPIAISLYFRFWKELPRHDMLSFLHSFFTMKAYLPEFHIEKLLLDSAHDAYPVYEYCRQENITPFIDLNPGHTGHFTYKGRFHH